jgi:hypothetical protein
MTLLLDTNVVSELAEEWGRMNVPDPRRSSTSTSSSRRVRLDVKI